MKIANKLVAKRNIRMKGGGRWKESEIVKYKYKQTRDFGEMCSDLFFFTFKFKSGEVQNFRINLHCINKKVQV